MLFFFKISNFIENTVDPFFSVDIDKQISYMRSLGNPVDDLDRSYFQYKCQMFLIGFLIKVAYNIVALPLIIYYLLFRLNREKILKQDDSEALLLFPNNPSIVPETLMNEYVVNQFSTYDNHFMLTEYDKNIIRKMRRRYPFSFYFILKCMLKIAMYRYAINTWNPKAIVVTSEYSFTSSILTDYCEGQGIEHINIMHGEKMMYIRDSFFRFSKCYVWDEFYKNLFYKLNAETTQFKIEAPPSQRPWSLVGIEKINDYTYYLAGEKKRRLLLIEKSLSVLKNKGFIIAIRPHPIDRNMKMINSIFSGYVLEDGDKVSIEQSVLQTQNAISFYSTVLLQAFNNNVNIVIDDLTDNKRFQILKKLDYSLMHLKHTKLSELLGMYK